MQAAWNGQGAPAHLLWQLTAGSERQQFSSCNHKHNPTLAHQAKPHQGGDTFLRFTLL